MRELESVKQDLSKLKLDMACLLENKSRVEKETEASTSRLRSHSNSIEGLKQEIEEANEEQVLVELARMEAVKEFEAIEAEREAEETKFTSTMEKTRKKIKELMRDIDRTKELEAKLAITAYDADVLQNELRPVRAMSGSFSSERNETSGESAKVTEELEAAKKELASIKEEGFQFMASMDIIRNELKHVSEENTRLKELEMKADSTVQNLNHKLLRDKSKLESVSSSEEKTNSIVSNLSVTLQQLTTEAEAAKTEKRLIAETTESIRAEKQKMENEIYLAEETLRTTIQELEEVKASEALALESLKTLSEKTMKDRASAAQHNSTITISQFEFKYLSGRAVGVEEVADKKVAAAQAWIEALKASEKEILMKTEIALREMNELKLAEEQRELDKQDGEQTKLRQQTEKPRRSTTLQGDAALPRKSIREYGNSAMPVRKSTAGRPNSPGGRYVNRSGSITLKRKPKVMPNLVKIFSSTET
ncbi:hypothetical protein IFM89_003014 [Coptis chinensis]|uniref:Uncharacterized protein n=1 Tax=Coptis chinensis TaxID=261450 RepID=A0A835IT85_9MAGN|nr:hypothetical protein IFM89_003014 [Coptis chinensis]